MRYSSNAPHCMNVRIVRSLCLPAGRLAGCWLYSFPTIPTARTYHTVRSTGVRPCTQVRILPFHLGLVVPLAKQSHQRWDGARLTLASRDRYCSHLYTYVRRALPATIANAPHCMNVRIV